jgi:hypothetical protein
MISSITQVQSPLNFLLNQVLICHNHPQIPELCHIFKVSVLYLYYKTSSSILLMRQHIQFSLHLHLRQPPY